MRTATEKKTPDLDNNSSSEKFKENLLAEASILPPLPLPLCARGLNSHATLVIVAEFFPSFEQISNFVAKTFERWGTWHSIQFPYKANHVAIAL